MSDADPVLAKRERLRRLAALGKRVGYTLFLVATATFVAGFFTSFNVVVAQVVVWSLAVGSVALAPGIVLSHAVRAADREDRATAAAARGSAGAGSPDDRA
ncbi:MAG TPA: hypothetical protein DEP66_03825 [Acidimicrobiaceae bacterium]|nr:hypothetical protein [Acidimicrobiaceae bacterium]